MGFFDNPLGLATTAMSAVNPVGMLGTGMSVAGPLISAFSSAKNQQDANDANMQLNLQQEQFNAQQTRQAQDFSAAQVQQQEGFQTTMSNTGYQRAVQDMQKAGLNPMLAYMQGPASSPSGASASGIAATTGSLRPMDPIPSVAGTALSSALGMAQTYASVQKDLAAKRNIDVDTINKGLESDQIPYKTKLILNEAMLANSRNINTAIDTELKNQEYNFRANQSDVESANPKLFGWGRALANLSPIGNSALGYANLLGGMIP